MNQLYKIRVDHQGDNQWYLKPETTKSGKPISKGHCIFRGDDEAFRKHLIKMKACDTDSEPASVRNMKYDDMVQKMKEPRRTYVWAYSNRWQGANKVMETQGDFDSHTYKVISHIRDAMIGDLYNMVLPGYEANGVIFLELGDGGEEFQLEKEDVVKIDESVEKLTEAGVMYWNKRGKYQKVWDDNDPYYDEEIRMKKDDTRVIEIVEEVKIPGTDTILEKGDKIRVLKEGIYGSPRGNKLMMALEDAVKSERDMGQAGYMIGEFLTDWIKDWGVGEDDAEMFFEGLKESSLGMMW